MGELICENLNAQIGERKLLNDINFSVRKGKTLMLIGQSGSGKSLICRMLLGGNPSSIEVSGKLMWNGIDLLKLKANDWEKYRGKEIAYITQNPMAVFNPMQTVFSHGYELFKSHMNCDGEKTRRLLIKAFRQFNLGEEEKLLDKFPFQLSGGMLQRIMLAMVLELSPSIIVADEPTSALDCENRDNVIEELKTVKEKGVSLLVITHDYHLAHSLADEVFIIKDGNMVEYGEAVEILNNPKTEYAKKLLKPRIFDKEITKREEILCSLG